MVRPIIYRYSELELHFHAGTQAYKFFLKLLLLLEKKNDGIKLTNDLILKRINLTDYIITPLYILK